MKISNLDLTAFGPFSGERIDFDESGAGLHVIFGPNEAGKSSALRALTAWLFGVPSRTADNFLHPNKDLRIGGKLVHSDGSELMFLRRKGNKDTLLDLEGNSLDDRALEKFLGTVNLEQFTALFGLSHDDLVRGGRQILMGEGEVGESLLSAGTGGASLRRIMQELAAGAEELYKKGGSANAISKAVSEYEQARKAVSEHLLPGSKWEEQDKALREAQAKRESLSAALQSRSAEFNRLDRTGQALPFIAARRDLLQELAGLAEARELPEDFLKKLNDARSRHSVALQMEKKALGDIERLKGDEEKLVVPETLLEQQENINALHERMGVRNKGVRDLPERQNELSRRLTEAKLILLEVRPDLELEQAGTLREGLEKKKLIRQLVGKHQALKQSLEKSEGSLGVAETELGGINDKLGALEASRDVSKLKRALSAVNKAGDITGEYGRLLAEAGEKEADAEIVVKQLPAFKGSLETLERLSVPDLETVDRFEKEMQTLQDDIGKRLEKAGELESRIRELDRKIDGLQKEGVIPAEGDLGEARMRREHGWGLVRRAWLGREEVSREEKEYNSDAPLPEAYELSVAQADEVADLLRSEADRVADLAQAINLREEDTTESSVVKAELGDLQNRMRDKNEAWREAWKQADMEPLTPREMRAWLARHKSILQDAKAIRDLKRKLDDTGARIEGFKALLAGCLIESGVRPGEGDELEALVELGQNLAEAIEATTRRRDQLERDAARLSTEVGKLGEAYDKAKKDFDEWRTEWAGVLAVLGLTGDTAPDDALILMDRLEEMLVKLNEAEGLKKRIAGIERDNRSFEEDVRNFVESLAPELAGLPPELAAAELNSRMVKGAKDASEKSRIAREIEGQKQNRLNARNAINAAEDDLKELCRVAACERHENLEEAGRRSDLRKRISEELRKLEEQLLALRKGGTLEQLINETSCIDADTLPSKMDEIRKELEGLEAQEKNAGEEIGAAKNELDKMDGNDLAAREAERAEEILASLRPNVEKYIRLYLAAIILRREFDGFITENQGPLLGRAGEFFATLTGGSFRGLKMGYNEQDKPVILGVRGSGGTLGVEGMSDGTCDQLYLALRLAYIERYLENSEPVPFIVDDVLIRFDDERAKAALRVLLELSLKTQVIFFTHHARLIDLVKKLSKDGRIRVHQLSAGSVVE